MSGGGTQAFIDPDVYEANLRPAQIELRTTPRGEFGARLIWAELHHLRLLYCEEAFAGISYLRLPTHLVSLSFPHSGPMPVWNGIQMQAGDVMLHGRGQRLHQSSLGPSGWGMIAVDPERLDHSYKALTGKALVMPAGGCLLQPARQNVARLQRLHAQASHLAETKARQLTHFEVARAIEQAMLPILISCLTKAKIPEDMVSENRCHEIVVSFEDVLDRHPIMTLCPRDVSKLVGVTDRTLRSCCDKFLGLSPARYLRLGQLKQVRIALRDADALAVDVAQIAGRYGFNNLPRFTSLYQLTFGELPSATLHRRGPTDFDSRSVFIESA